MKTNVTPKREAVELCTLKPGDAFIPSDYEEDGCVYMVVNSRSTGGVYLDFELGDIVGVCLDDGEISTFGSNESVYAVKGGFTGEY